MSSDHIQVSIHLSGATKAAVEAQAAAESKSPATLLEGWIVEKVASLPGVLPRAESRRVRAEHELFCYLDDVLKEVRGTDWDEDVTREIFKRIESELYGVYRDATHGDPAVKNRINKRIGARVREGLGAVTRSARRGGPPRKGNVSNALITSYTKLFKA